MTPELDARQAVPMTKRDKKRLHRAAADLNLGPGLLARALIRSGLSRMGEVDVQAHVHQESEEARARWSRAGRAAIAARYEKKNE